MQGSRIIRMEAGNRLILKKPHPCGCAVFDVIRVGSDIHIRCTGCGHDVTVPRLKLEKNIRHVTDSDGNILPSQKPAPSSQEV